MKQILKKTFYVPKPVEKEQNDIIRWGSDGLYPQWLNWLYYASATHQGIINGKVFFTTSGGLNYQGGEDLEKLVDQFEKIMPEMSRSLELSNSYYLKGRLSLDKTRIESVQYIPFEHVRATTDKNTWRISKEWHARNAEYTELHTLKVAKKSTDRTQLHFIIPFQRKGLQFQLDGVGKRVSENYYPVVPYSGAINSILTDIELTNYGLSQIVNHFSLSTILSLNNGMVKDDDDKKRLLSRISDETTGSDNAGGVMVLFNNGKETAPTVEHLNGNQLNERYVTLSEDARANMMRGHSVVSGELFGFMNDGNFNASVIDYAYYIMKNNYFRQRQMELLEPMEEIMEFNGISGTVEFNDVELPLERTEPATTQPAPAPQAEEFAKEVEKTEDDATKEVLAALANVGVPRDERKILMSEPLNHEHAFGGAFEGGQPEKFATAIELQVLNLMMEGESFDAISKALGINPSDLAKLYQKLKRGGHVDANGQITEAGRVESIRSQVAKLEILYSYEVRPGVGPEILPNDRTRLFCKTMIEENKFYTRMEIDNISNDLGTDVWQYRGGWWNDNGTNKPSCRHIWVQHVTYKNT